MTVHINYKAVQDDDFNPHSRVGSDLQYCIAEATVVDFNPHSRVGSDTCKGYASSSWKYFNPHSRVGSDQDARRKPLVWRDFNPHSRVGSDPRWDFGDSSGIVFQSTLPRREWLDYHTQSQMLVVFQSTLPRREWPRRDDYFAIMYNFNPHSRVGSDFSFSFFLNDI